MKARIDWAHAAPGAVKAMLALETYTRKGGLEPQLLDLVKIRASQINGCAFCLDMHIREAREAGETEARIYLLDAWSESPVYSERERAALAWTDAVTLVSQTHVPDDVFEQARHYFSDEELVNLTLAVAAINAWNRINVGFRTVPPVHAAPAGKLARAG
jgi:AhpD family alkylhydroperoxidase